MKHIGEFWATPRLALASLAVVLGAIFLPPKAAAHLPPDFVFTAQTSRLEETMQRRRLQYRRQRLQVRPLTRVYWPSFLFLWRPRARFYPAMAVDPLFAGFPRPYVQYDWAIVQGNVRMLDDLTFAKVIGDEALHSQLAASQRRSRLWWRGGLSGVASGSVATASWLQWGSGHPSPDRQVLATSLFIIGATSAIMALVYDGVGTGHTLGLLEAQQRVDAYNEALRRRLRLRPAQVPACESKAPHRHPLDDAVELW